MMKIFLFVDGAESDQAPDKANDIRASASTTELTQLTQDHLEAEQPTINDSSVRVNCSENQTRQRETDPPHLPSAEPHDFLLSAMYPPEYAIPIYGYLIPVVALITVISDSLLCIVLLKKEMRSPTNALLVAIAISDMLTGLIPAPVLVYFFATDRFWEFVPYEWCWAFFTYLTIFHTGRMFHTASI
ncbi:hypothetical protein BaRGS_00030015 [Batillaria attramentaria]|uniref:G-protein coupled receptors family 1 profile domain-containing protein n=1 Tax=Batillaria attramentaria TaxID=370345 RepID=A0ABD0JVC7_9CAEN